jgi:transcription elongation factor GreA
MELAFRDIANKKDVAANRKINRNIQNYLFKEQILENFLLEQKEDSVVRIFTLLKDVKDLDPVQKLNLKQKLVKKYPAIKSLDTSKEPETVSSSKILYVSEKGYNGKQKELKHILEVEIPKNSKEIGKAIELGDLKENAEYKAGKEKQESLNIAVGKLKDELDRARVIKPEDVDSSKAAFGVIVDLKNLISGDQENFTLLGPWESDPSKNVISYLSPFGSELIGHKKGEKLDFEINERKYSYEITEIRAADF